MHKAWGYVTVVIIVLVVIAVVSRSTTLSNALYGSGTSASS